jgi:hypothetical protein
MVIVSVIERGRCLVYVRWVVVVFGVMSTTEVQNTVLMESSSAQQLGPLTTHDMECDGKVS